MSFHKILLTESTERYHAKSSDELRQEYIKKIQDIGNKPDLPPKECVWVSREWLKGETAIRGGFHFRRMV